MTTFNEVNKLKNKVLLNNLSDNEIVEFYKNLNRKLINNIGVIENGFKFNKFEVDKYKKILQESNLIFSEKFYSNELDSNTKFNVLLYEYLKLQEKYILNEYNYSLIFVINISKSLLLNIDLIEGMFLDIGFNYYSNSLSKNLMFFNLNIDLAVHEIEKSIDLYNKLSLTILEDSSIYANELEPLKEFILTELDKIETYIYRYNKLKANPFEKVVKLELETIEKVYSDKPKIAEHEKEQILNNVPTYDFNNFELILPEIDPTEKGVVN